MVTECDQEDKEEEDMAEVSVAYNRTEVNHLNQIFRVWTLFE